MRVLYVKKPAPTRPGTFTLQLLKGRGFITERAVDGIEALEFLADLDFDCILVSEPVADMTTAKLVRLIRANKITTPILVRVDDGCGTGDTAADALNAGADDYLRTPPSDEELISRIRALARRRLGLSTTTIELGSVTLDLAARTATLHGAPVRLTGKEYEMLELMATRRGRVISRGDFLSHLYQQCYEPDAKIIDVFICKLRKKIGYDIFENVWGRGYMIPAASMLRTESSRPKTSEPLPAQPHDLTETNWRTTPAA